MDKDYTLEKLKINERLGALEVEIAYLKSLFTSELGGSGSPGNVNRNLTDMFKQLTEIIKILQGDEGLMMRLDRLEIIERDRKWTLRVMVTTTLALVGNLIYQFFTKK